MKKLRIVFFIYLASYSYKWKIISILSTSFVTHALIYIFFDTTEIEYPVFIQQESQNSTKVVVMLCIFHYLKYFGYRRNLFQIFFEWCLTKRHFIETLELFTSYYFIKSLHFQLRKYTPWFFTCYSILNSVRC